MIRLASWLSALAISVASTLAGAAPRLAAVVPAAADADVRTATVVGPSGQLYLGDGSGRWVRRAAGGIAADVTAATRADGDVIAAGPRTPLFRFDGTAWTAHKLGQNGRVVLGQGPLPAVAIGDHIFVERKANARARTRRSWLRVGELPGPIIALWAASPASVFVVTAAGVHALRGKELVRTRAPVGSVVGARPWGITADGAIDLASGRRVLAAAGVVAATGGASAPWLLVTAEPGLRLVGRTGTAPATIDTPIPPGTVIAGLAADRTGRVLVATADGQLHVWTDGAWIGGALIDELPAPRPGPGPAPTS